MGCSMKNLAAAVMLMLAPAAVWAGALDLSLSDEAANIVYVFNNDPLNPQRLPARGGSELSAGIFVNEDDSRLFHGTLLARGYRQTSTTQYQVSAGMRLIGGDINVDGRGLLNSTDDESVGALALGVQAGILLRPADYNPVELTFEGFYAPSITSFSDAERYAHLSVRLQVEIMPRASAYIGYRRVRFDTNDFDNLTLDRSAHVGLVISF